MTTTLDDEPTIAEVLAILDDDVVRLLDTTTGALITHRDVTDSDQEDKREALAMAADLLAQAWANTRRAAEIVRADVHDEPVPPRFRVVKQGTRWYVVGPSDVYLAMSDTHADAMDAAIKYARRLAA